MVAIDEKQQESKPEASSSSFQAPASTSPAALPSPSPGRGKREEDEEVGLNASQLEKAKAKAKSYPTFLGRHRMSAAITHLNNQINIIQEELNELESVGQSSSVCKELVSSLETIPDPLLPTTKGPPDVNWDRWFRGAHNSRSHKRWI